MTTTPAGFGSFFKDHSTAQNALDRAATSGQQLSSSFGNIGNVSQQLTQNALDYNATGKADAAAGGAMADVRSTLDKNQQSNERRMASMGIRPDSGRFAGDNTEQVASALAQVTAGNQARQQVEDTAQSRLKDALSANSTASSLGLALDGSVIDSAYKTVLSDRQNQLNAAQLALNRYSVDKGVQFNNQKLQAQSDQATGQMWGNAANLGLTLLKDSGALSGAADAIKNWWNS